jgi:hypothetical protein
MEILLSLFWSKGKGRIWIGPYNERPNALKFVKIENIGQLAKILDSYQCHL